MNKFKKKIIIIKTVKSSVTTNGDGLIKDEKQMWISATINIFIDKFLLTWGQKNKFSHSGV